MANSFAFDGSGGKTTRSSHCVAFEELLADGMDGSLGEIDALWFERHVQTCAECGQLFAEAQRGAAWLELLKGPRPEPSAALMQNILAQTTVLGAAGVAEQNASFSALIPGRAVALPFRPRPAVPAASWARLPHAMFEPRLAMTAAMAVFSLALTMNLAGVQLGQLRPSNLRHAYYESTSGAARYCDNLRVVRVVESRVDDLREENQEQSAPARTPNRPVSRPAPAGKPGKANPADGVSWREFPANRPKTLQAEAKRHSPNDAGDLV